MTSKHTLSTLPKSCMLARVNTDSAQECKYHESPSAQICIAQHIPLVGLLHMYM